jgi:RNA polymerase sigma factor (sigma-70 family)
MSLQSPDDLSGEDLFLSQLGTIERVTEMIGAQHHLSGADASDFGSHVKLRLIENDYAVLRKFEGRSSFRTFLSVVIQRLLLDYRISAWGKWRPSEEAKRIGSVGVLFEQLLVRDGLPFDDVCERLRTNHGVKAGAADFERIAARLPARMRRRFESDELLEQKPAPNHSADGMATEHERQATADRVSATLTRVMAGWTTQDQLIVSMKFQDNRTVATIAATLHTDQKALYRRLERLLKELRKELEGDGIDGAAIREMFESPAVSIDWSIVHPENTSGRPSTGKGAAEWR